MSNKLMISGFLDEAADALVDQIAVCKKLGIRYIEVRKVDGINIADLTDEQVWRLKELLEEAGIGITSIGSPLGKISLDADFEQYMETVSRVYDIAGMLGVKYVRMFSFYPPENGSFEGRREEVLEKLERMLTLAESRGLILCHENEARIYGESPENCLDLLEHFGGRLRAVFDAGNFVLGGYESYPHAYNLLKPYVEYFHIKDAVDGKIVPAGEGSGGIAETLREHLDSVENDVIISLEPHLFNFTGLKNLSPEELKRVHVYHSMEEAFTAGAEAIFRMPVDKRQVDQLLVKGYADRDCMGHAAAKEIADCIRKLLTEKETINMIFAAAPSQNETLDYLCKEPDIDWTRIHAFHMDEYIGLAEAAPQRFYNFLREAIFDKKPFRAVYGIDSANEPDAEAARYAALLEEYPVDIVCMGVGENGHIAFNDPGVADFNDPYLVKRAVLDEVCRMQQVHDGCFPNLEAVPKEALTLTVPALYKGRYLFCMVPGPTKAAAITRMLSGEVSDECPATILRRHENAVLYCDRDSLL